MTIDTTFKEFVNENGITFCVLDFSSRKYRSLVEAFNNAKSKLSAEEETRDNERIRVWAKEQSAIENLRSRRAVRARRGARAAISQPRKIASL
jgi:hypothetical protein